MELCIDLATGSEVLVTLPRKKYRGRVYSVSRQKLILERVKDEKTKQRVLGSLTLFQRDILALEVIAEGVPKKKSKDELQKEYLLGQGLIRSLQLSENNVNPSKKEDGKSLPEELWLHHMLIDSPGQIFDVAIDEIKKEKVVGVNFEGVGSTLSLVSIAIPRETFLFDIVVLVGGSKFLLPMPLKNILESKKLLKVITSSKSCSRYLLAYSIHMNGILDIQEGGEALLMRPLSSEQKVTATQKASALLLKYDDILKQYLARFHECIDLYLSAWRDISTEERASAAMAMSHKAPPAVVQVLSLKFGEQERKFNRQRAIDEDHNKDDPMPSLLESPAWIKAIRASSHHPSST